MTNSFQDKLLEYAIADAIKAREFAYAPYSQYYVGATILLENGSTVMGSNIENSSFGATMCAERVAIFNWKSHFNKSHRELKPIALIFATDSIGFGTPCGLCLQVMLEFFPPETLIGHHNGQSVKFYTFKELIPHTHKVEVLTR